MLCDSFDRKIEYVRLSVTDLCNIRCQYCIPASGAVKGDRKDILSYEEMARLVAVFAQLGVRSVRITGGEPLVRKDIAYLVSMLRAIPELDDILMTTNGFQLKRMAPQLKLAGLTRINVHLDTLDPVVYSQITRWGNIDDVLEGIDAAQKVGFAPIKLNSVLLRGYNDNELEAMAYYAAERDLILRFIELMPIGPGRDMGEHYMSAKSVREQLSERWTLIPHSETLGRGPAEYYKIAELDSVIGFIHAVSDPFCENCNRVRIGADGRLQDCLAYDESVDLRKLLRTPGISDAKLADAIRSLVGMKRKDHGEFVLPQYKATCGMYGIGG